MRAARSLLDLSWWLTTDQQLQLESSMQYKEYYSPEVLDEIESVQNYVQPKGVRFDRVGKNTPELGVPVTLLFSALAEARHK